MTIDGTARLSMNPSAFHITNDTKTIGALYFRDYVVWRDRCVGGGAAKNDHARLCLSPAVEQWYLEYGGHLRHLANHSLEDAPGPSTNVGKYTCN